MKVSTIRWRDREMPPKSEGATMPCGIRRPLTPPREARYQGTGQGEDHMRQRVLGFAAAVAVCLMGGPTIHAAGKKHLIVVHSSNNTGQGTVTVNRSTLHAVPLNAEPAGACAKAVCGASYAQGTRVTLTATAAEGSTFTGWSGECEGTSPTCTVRLDRSRDVMVHFTK